ncbi:hypothetical protein GZ78_21900 [Endozoicomonas numazuensis]|uniref:Uncharacterized protein n=1 Tax=Endozoicomonas numazuensis TaxID=1137799 RepID=A0A081NDI5_9GAMM|nr:hypothetical protein GZ78_21900 [Endozoicomonas numazuensis]
MGIKIQKSLVGLLQVLHLIILVHSQMILIESRFTHGKSFLQIVAAALMTGSEACNPYPF